MIVLHCLFSRSFLGDNIFCHMVVKARQPFGKAVLYDFLRNERFNWRRLLLLLAARAGLFYRRRQESIAKSIDLLEPMVKRILSHGIRAGYIFIDSWFGMPVIISRHHKHLPHLH